MTIFIEALLCLVMINQNKIEMAIYMRKFATIAMILVIVAQITNFSFSHNYVADMYIVELVTPEY